MNKVLKLIVLSLLFVDTAQSQLTVKDFKLCLDNVPCSDSVLMITKEQLLKSKKIIPNYSWFIIESATVYIGEGNFTSEIFTVNLPKNEFTAGCKEYFERLRPGEIVTIEVKGHNKQNLPVEWGVLSIRVVDK